MPEIIYKLQEHKSHFKSKRREEGRPDGYFPDTQKPPKGKEYISTLCFSFCQYNSSSLFAFLLGETGHYHISMLFYLQVYKVEGSKQVLWCFYISIRRQRASGAIFTSALPPKPPSNVTNQTEKPLTFTYFDYFSALCYRLTLLQIQLTTKILSFCKIVNDFIFSVFQHHATRVQENLSCTISFGATYNSG